MFQHVLIPVDLSHTDKLDKALETGAEIAKQHGATVEYVGVTADAPGPGGRTPEDFSKKLDAFAAGQAKAHGIEASGKAVFCNDPAVELNHALLDTIKASSADLVVMASHVPGVPEHFFSSHAGAIASHAKISVLVVR